MSIKILDEQYRGVILNDNKLSAEYLVSLHEEGYLVLSTGDTIEIEDDETGELYEGQITINEDNKDFFLFDVYENGKIVHEEEVSLLSYLLQLKRCGALDAYPMVSLE